MGIIIVLAAWQKKCLFGKKGYIFPKCFGNKNYSKTSCCTPNLINAKVPTGLTYVDVVMTLLSSGRLVSYMLRTRKHFIMLLIYAEDKKIRNN